MSWKAALVWDNERIEVDGSFDSEDEAKRAALEDVSNLHLGNSISAWNGDDYDDTDPEIEIWEDDD